MAVDGGQVVGELDVELSPPPRAIHALPVTLSGAGVQLLELPVEFCGWSLRETTGSAGASVDFYTGSGTGGELIASTAPASGMSTSLSLNNHGVWARRGIYVNVVSGAVTGVVWYRRRH
jgi:hypothetical protein